MKFMDRLGSGINKIKNGTNRLFDDGNNHVEFNATDTHFSVVIYNANYEKGREIVKQILDSHKFKYGVNSTYNEGSEFYFIVPKENIIKKVEEDEDNEEV